MKRIFKILIGCSYFVLNNPVNGQIITTIGGGYLGNNVASKSIGISPAGIVTDKLGNIYISDQANNTVRKINLSTGINTIIAGNGSQGYSGDGGPATAAELYGPYGLAIDTANNIYISEWYGCVIRKINSITGIITTIAGNGNSGSSGDGGPATAAEVYEPAGISLDSNGNIYIADYGNNKIREVNAVTGLINTIAGTGTLGYNGDGIPATSAKLSYPSSVCVDPKNNIYIADSYNNRIRLVSASNGNISTIAGTSLGYSGDGGPATKARLYIPSCVCLDDSGNVYIADEDNSCIRKVTISSGIINTIVGNGVYGFFGDGGPATDAQLAYPLSISLDSSGDIFIVDSKNYVIREIKNSTNIINTIAGNISPGYNGDGIMATNTQLMDPSGIDLDGVGNIFIADNGNNRIREINVSTGLISTFAGNGVMGYTGDNILADSAEFKNPDNIAFDKSGNLYVSDMYNLRIRKVNLNDTISTIAGTGTYGFNGDGGNATSAEIASPFEIAINKSMGAIYFADGYNQRIRQISNSGMITTIAGDGTQGYSGDGGMATSAALFQPMGVAIDTTGNIYVADTYNSRIRKINSITGIITTIAGNGTSGYKGDGGPADSAELFYPYGIAVDPLGRLFIADTYNNRIRMVDLKTDSIYSIAGDGVQGFAGDGGTPISAEIDRPENIAFDAFDNMYIADYGNNRIRKVTAPLGIDELSSQVFVEIYPNPSRGIFNLKIEQMPDNSIIEIYDILGEVIYQHNINSVATSIDIRSHPAGIYLYRILSGKGEAMASGKLIIQ